MLTGRDIVLISSIEWDFNWQGHQEISKRLAESGNRVLYIENMGVRAPVLRDAKRVASRFSRWARSIPEGGVREIAENLFVCSPMILPPFGSRIRREINRRALLKLIQRTVKKLRFHTDVVWTFLPTDTAASLVRMLRRPNSVLVYYCIADFAELAPAGAAMIKSERAIIEMSDLIFAQCHQLAEHCAAPGRNVEILPFGVNLNVFGNGNGHQNGTHSVLHDEASLLMSALPRPIIGYVGGIHKFFDTKLVATMARLRPDWSWVLVGPPQIPVPELKRLPNVYLSGLKPHDQLPSYIKRFDVGIVPYISNEKTRAIVPTKINEYLAMGKPVVASNLPEVDAFNDRHGVLITSPNDASEFIGCIENALASSSEEDAVARRQVVAALSDWKHRCDHMAVLVEEALAKRVL